MKNLFNGKIYKNTSAHFDFAKLLKHNFMQKFKRGATLFRPLEVIINITIYIQHFIKINHISSQTNN